MSSTTSWSGPTIAGVDRKRRLALALGVGLLAVPFGALAQQRRFRVAFLSPSPSPAKIASATYIHTLTKRLGELGYVEGGNLIFDMRFADNAHDRLPALARELIALKPDVLIASTTLAIRAAQQATDIIPIVMAPVTDPVGSGFIKSLARPGGNITGVANLYVDTSAKLVELARDLIPSIKRVGFLTMSLNPTHATQLEEGMRAARSYKFTPLPHGITSPEQIDTAFASLAREKCDALVVFNEPMFSYERQRLAALATRYRLPVVYQSSANVDAGGLISYGVNVNQMFVMAADYTAKILKGAKPADLPVEQPMRLELVVNTKTAKELGLKIPQLIFLRADRVIE